MDKENIELKEVIEDRIELKNAESENIEEKEKVTINECDFIEVKRDKDITSEQIEELETLEREVERLKYCSNQNIDLNLELDKRNIELKKLEVEKDKYVKEVENLRKVNEINSQELLSLKEELENDIENASVAEKYKVKELTEKIDVYKEKINKKEDRISKLEKKKVALEAENKKSTEEIVNLREQVRCLNIDLAEQAQEATENKKKFDESKKQNNIDKLQHEKEVADIKKKADIRIKDLESKLEINESHFVRGNRVVNESINQADLAFGKMIRRYNISSERKTILITDMNKVMRNLFSLRRYYIGKNKELNSTEAIVNVIEALQKIVECESKDNTEGILSETAKLSKIQYDIEKLKF